MLSFFATYILSLPNFWKNMTPFRCPSLTPAPIHTYTSCPQKSSLSHLYLCLPKNAMHRFLFLSGALGTPISARVGVPLIIPSLQVPVKLVGSSESQAFHRTRSASVKMVWNFAQGSIFLSPSRDSQGMSPKRLHFHLFLLRPELERSSGSSI